MYVLDRNVDEPLSSVCLFREQARMAPFYAENGMPDGYRIWGIQPGSSWLRMGIQNEDVVRRVNGETLDNPDKCWKVWLEALRARWIDIEIDRKGHAVLNIVRLRA